MLRKDSYNDKYTLLHNQTQFWHDYRLINPYFYGFNKYYIPTILFATFSLLLFVICRLLIMILPMYL